MLDIALRQGHIERRRAAFAGRTVALVARRAIEETRNCCGDEFNVADLLDTDALDQVTIWFCVPTKVEALKQILHHCTHLAKLTPQALLQSISGSGIRLVWNDLIDQFLHMEKHLLPLYYHMSFLPKDFLFSVYLSANKHLCLYKSWTSTHTSSGGHATRFDRRGVQRGYLSPRESALPGGQGILAFFFPNAAACP